jgi:hypothetical protein
MVTADVTSFTFSTVSVIVPLTEKLFWAEAPSLKKIKNAQSKMKYLTVREWVVYKNQVTSVSSAL